MSDSAPAQGSSSDPGAALPVKGTTGHQASTATLAFGAVGIVFGDIGTSPLYAFRETFAGTASIAIDRMHVLGVVSLIFWSMTLIVAIQYVTILMRADNKGQGGSLALVALISRHIGKTSYGWLVALLGVFATSLFYGDSMITPAISVLSAVEGLTVVDEGLQDFVIPIALALLVFLFVLQARGTAKVGALFAPVMIVYFTVIALLGSWQIISNPDILWALNPYYAVMFFVTDGLVAFLALGAVVLAVTGAEALYSDMGHFGRGPMRLSWFGFVMPCLLLNYFGQGAMIAGLPPEQAAEVVRNPFFLLASEEWRLPLVFLATMATFIASQAVISGAFSITHQAAVIILVLTFQTSSNLANAYGIAVTGAVTIDTVLMGVLFIGVWKWKWWYAAPIVLLFLIVDGAYFAANLTKVGDGGWFPLVVGLFAFTLLTTWARGRKLMRDRMGEVALPIEIFAKSAQNSATRVPGTAIFMASSTAGVPSALLHNIKHNKVLHERVVILTVEIQDVPYVDPEQRCEFREVGSGFYRAVLHYGFMDETNVPEGLKIGRAHV